MLAECISATAQPEADANGLLKIPLHDSLQTVRNLLQLIYSSAVSAKVGQLLKESRQQLWDVIRLADKYDMPKLLNHIDLILSWHDSCLWEYVSEAIDWAELASTTDL